jgi:hypothetical protein
MELLTWSTTEGDNELLLPTASLPIVQSCTHHNPAIETVILANLVAK